MARKSLYDRREELEARRGNLEQHAAERALAQASPVHVQTVEVLTDLLQMGRAFSTDAVPAPLRVMMRTLERMKPALIEELSTVPEDQIRAFMATLRDKMGQIIDAGQEERSA